ncbi:MAG: hypothetical protein LBE74_01045 [Treponema sp.]|jgi:hypothetical protein|nr:hypothetical protein [Treponema sp.]
MPNKLSNKKGYVPGADAKFNSYNLVTYTVGKMSGQPSAWDHIPAARVTELSTANEKWRLAFEKVAGPRSSVDTKAKNNTRKEACVRAFVAQYIRFPPVADEDRDAMDILNRDLHPARIEKPKTRPVVTEIKPLGAFREEIYFHDETTEESCSIPYGDNGCLLLFGWGAKPIDDYKALVQTKLMTKSPCIVTLPQEAEKQVFSCAAEWQNERGELGPPSEIKTADVWR